MVQEERQKNALEERYHRMLEEERYRNSKPQAITQSVHQSINSGHLKPNLFSEATPASPSLGASHYLGQSLGL